MSAQLREETHWRALRKQMVDEWNRDHVDDFELEDEANLRFRVRVPHRHDDDDHGRRDSQR